MECKHLGHGAVCDDHSFVDDSDMLRQLLGLFKGEAVGRGVVLQPATMQDMCGAALNTKPSLEVVYEAV